MALKNILYVPVDHIVCERSGASHARESRQSKRRRRAPTCFRKSNGLNGLPTRRGKTSVVGAAVFRRRYLSVHLFYDTFFSFFHSFFTSSILVWNPFSNRNERRPLFWCIKTVYSTYIYIYIVFIVTLYILSTKTTAININVVVALHRGHWLVSTNYVQFNEDATLKKFPRISTVFVSFFSGERVRYTQDDHWLDSLDLRYKKKFINAELHEKYRIWYINYIIR